MNMERIKAAYRAALPEMRKVYPDKREAHEHALIVATMADSAVRGTIDLAGTPAEGTRISEHGILHLLQNELTPLCLIF